MELPDHITRLLDAAHRAFEAHRTGTGTLHDSSMATIDARDALMGWAMNEIYRPNPTPSLDSLIEGDDTSAAMKAVIDRMVARHRSDARRAVAS